MFQAEDGIRDLVRSRGLGDVYKRQGLHVYRNHGAKNRLVLITADGTATDLAQWDYSGTCLLYTSDAADERSSVDLGGRRIINKKKNVMPARACLYYHTPRPPTINSFYHIRPTIPNI